MTEELFVGIDVSKAQLDVAIRPTGEVLRRDNTQPGIASLASYLSNLKPTLVILEATGGYERALVSSLAAADLPVVVMNARQVRAFARATGQLAKTDRIDARVLAQFAEAVRPELRTLPDADTRGLEALVTRRRQVIGMMNAEHNRLETCADTTMRAEIEATIAFLREQRGRLDAAIAKLLQDSPAWREPAERLQSVPGVGPVLAATLLSALPELGQVSNKRVSALVGVAPINRDSGRHKGYRAVSGGRREVRAVLYMATVASLRVNPVIRSFFKHLVARGKAKKVALTACMRKLLTILNAIARTGVPWREDFTHLGPCS